MALKSLWIAFASFCLVCFLLAKENGSSRVVHAAAAAGAQQLFSFSHPAMGTTYTLLLYADRAQDASAEAAKAFATVDDIETLLSNYKPQSELSRINNEAYAGPVTTDPETFAFLKTSLDWSARSDGAFDITVGALMKAWGFFRSTGRVPSAAELARVRAESGWRKVRLDPATRMVRFTAPGIELDPGGIGKGFAVDRVVSALRNDGVENALISAGSSTIYGLGAPPGHAGWRVDVPDPARPGSAVAFVLLRNTSLSTASCTEKHFVLAGHLYCHIMDPRLALPVEGRLQATVITPSATDGDALSNVMFVDDAAARASIMRQMGAEDSALVFSGIPAEDRDRAGSQPRAAGHTPECDSYRWPGTIPADCVRVGAAKLSNVDGRKGEDK
jgi:thiamine biosynthesis lipoprotein